MAQEATPAARWHYEPQATSDQMMGVEVTHRVGWYRPGASPFFSPGCWSCRRMEEFIMWGWDNILPGCGETSALARGAALPARQRCQETAF